MTNFKIKDDIFFTLEKSEGNIDFPRKFFAKKVSGNQIKISTLGSNEVLLVDVWQLDTFTINGATYTDVHEAIVALQPIIFNEDVSAAPIDYTGLLTSIYEAVDDLELTTENIRIEAGQINLNTDEVEEKLDLLIDLSTPVAMQNKSYKLGANQTITFEKDSVYGWVAGVYAGTASYVEGGATIGDYTQGESFGNGDQVNKVLNYSPITINSLADGDVRISVLQTINYSPLIS